ncbi:XRE family transcriptional regulator [Bdellovibrio sp. HCB209]|uniref:XRE family transcriptional regulator n=1 Tax=Bdellovibrio sp. HCB209 TaxID=3394354 RepID=UPI0039B3CCEA
MKRKTSGTEIAKMLQIPPARGIEAVMKAQIIFAVKKVVERESLTHTEIATRAKLPRSAVTGILSGSLQKVTIDRLLRLADSVGLTAHLVLKKSA